MKKLEENNVYFYVDRNKIIHNFREFNKFGNVYYPLKANSNEIILKILKPLINEINNGFLISYISHYEALKEIGVNPNKMCLINVLAEKESVKYLYKEGVRYFTFDNLDSLKDFAEYADLNETKIVFRLSSTEVFNDKFIHLGCNTDECKEMISYLKGKCANYGISFYIQKEIKLENKSLEKMLEYIDNNFKGLDVSFINIAGLKQYYEVNGDSIKDVKKKMKLKEVILEPGKHLIGEAIDMETRIIKTKAIKNKAVVVIKNGIFSGFFDTVLYDEQFELYLKSREDGNIRITYEKIKDTDFEFVLCGGALDSKDILGTMYIDDKYKNELVVGSKIYAKSVGSYFEEFFMPAGGDLNKVYKFI